MDELVVNLYCPIQIHFENAMVAFVPIYLAGSGITFDYQFMDGKGGSIHKPPAAGKTRSFMAKRELDGGVWRLMSSMDKNSRMKTTRRRTEG